MQWIKQLSTGRMLFVCQCSAGWRMTGGSKVNAGLKDKWNPHLFPFYYSTAYRDVSCMGAKMLQIVSFYPVSIETSHFHMSYLCSSWDQTLSYTKSSWKLAWKRLENYSVCTKSSFFSFLCFVRSSTSVLLHVHFIVSLLKLEIAFSHSIKIWIFS